MMHGGARSTGDAGVNVRVHAVEPRSRANGPGIRTAIWLQGCSLGCPGCFNPETHEPPGGTSWTTARLSEWIIAQKNAVEGVTFSGGEPLEQSAALLDILERIDGLGLSVVLFSGFRLAEIVALPFGARVLERVDVLVAGRYDVRRRTARGLLGSANQTAYFLTDRYSPADLERVPRRELIIRRDGTVTASGIDPVRL